MVDDRPIASTDKNVWNKWMRLPLVGQGHAAIDALESEPIQNRSLHLGGNALAAMLLAR